MSNQRFSPEFKDEAVRQIVDRGYSVAEVSERLGVSAHSLYKWVKAIKPDKTDEQSHGKSSLAIIFNDLPERSSPMQYRSGLCTANKRKTPASFTSYQNRLLLLNSDPLLDKSSRLRIPRQNFH